MPTTERDAYSRRPVTSRIGVLAALFITGAANAADMPIGIPEPGFGIDDSHRIYAGQPGYLDAGQGPYTHYVDNRHADCSDAGQGTAAQPRCTLPTIINAGEVVEVHGGPYTAAKITLSLNGTAQQPAFLHGVDEGQGYPKLLNANVLQLLGRHFVLEKLILDGTRLMFGNKDSHSQYAAVRHTEITRHPSMNGANLYGQELVFFGNHVHHNQGNDRHGAYVDSGSQRVWFLSNYFHHNGGDAIQFCHRCTDNPPDTIFIGANRMHSDRENGVDLKYAKNVVISQNDLSRYRPVVKGEEWCFDDGSGCGVFTSGSDGSAIVVGSDGAPSNVWVLFNNIYDSNNGVRVEEADGDNWVIANTIYQINDSGLVLQKRADPLHVINNTFHGMRQGLYQYWRDTFRLSVSNNLFSNISPYPVYYKTLDVAEQSPFHNNLLWNPSAPVTLKWRNDITVTDSESLNALSTASQANLLTDPKLSDPTQAQFAPLTNSPLLGGANASLEAANSQYRSLFGEGLDIRGGLGRDIGAHGKSGLPAAPSDLQISSGE